MSDNRRRRKSQLSDDLSDSYDELNTTKETRSSEATVDHDSEYDTAGSPSDTESQDKNQRESGDGQEEEKSQKKLDDDEDRRNPQYIPKKGTFYEHDDRTAEEVTEETTEVPNEREVKDKKVWKDKEDRWNHDRYNDEEQAPKSHAELIAIYGYDIRNEEGPPRARRRRRYGRGPNRYTRNWEDEDAYGKVVGSAPSQKSSTRKSKTCEEFPALCPKDQETTPNTKDTPSVQSAWYSSKNKVHPNKVPNFPPLQNENQKSKSRQFTNSQMNENRTSNDRNNISLKKEPKGSPFIKNSNECNTSIDSENILLSKSISRDKRPQIHESVNFVSTKSRGRGFKSNTNNNNVGTRTVEPRPIKGRDRPGPINIDSGRTSNDQEQISNDIKSMSITAEGPSYHHAARPTKHFYSQPSSQPQTSVVPPRMQPSLSQPQVQQQQQPQPPAQQPLQQQQQQQQQQTQAQDMSTSRPKRYSSLRQRPAISEGPPTPTQSTYQPAPPPPPPQHTYYPPPQAGNSRAVLETPAYAPGPYEPSAPVPSTTAAMGGQPVLPIPPTQPTSYPPHAPPPFLVPPPQFIPPQTAPPPNIINYVPGPNGPIFQPNYQGYTPAAVPPGPPPPQEVGIYQPQGCTYYSPAQQQQQQQQPLRRPKAAIPILPPPENLQNPANRARARGIPDQQLQEHLVQQQFQQQQDQLVQQQLQHQQQQQEQLVQQQLQQHQQQLIQQQQAEQLAQQQEKERLVQEQFLQQQQQERLHQEQLAQQQQKERQVQEQLAHQQAQENERLQQEILAKQQLLERQRLEKERLSQKHQEEKEMQKQIPQEQEKTEKIQELDTTQTKSVVEQKVSGMKEESSGLVSEMPREISQVVDPQVQVTEQKIVELVENQKSNNQINEEKVPEPVNEHKLVTTTEAAIEDVVDIVNVQKGSELVREEIIENKLINKPEISEPVNEQKLVDTTDEQKAVEANSKQEVIKELTESTDKVKIVESVVEQKPENIVEECQIRETTKLTIEQSDSSHKESESLDKSEQDKQQQQQEISKDILETEHKYVSHKSVSEQETTIQQQINMDSLQKPEEIIQKELGKQKETIESTQLLESSTNDNIDIAGDQDKPNSKNESTMEQKEIVKIEAENTKDQINESILIENIKKPINAAALANEEQTPIFTKTVEEVSTISNTVMPSDKMDNVLTKTDELVSGQSETDTSIKECVVIKEAAA